MTELMVLIQVLLQVLIFAIFGRAIVTWLPIDRNGPIVRTLDAITEPILSPLRKVIPTIGTIDLTPMVAIIVLLVLSEVFSVT